jgi:D-alanyl-D-alanine carboxypeptidase/D-alanyl-D-alanine-endopeptidase (penicillin-binding protein 4)
MSRVVACLIALLVPIAPAAAEAAGPAATKRALKRQMAHAGASSGAYVVDMDSGATLFSRSADVARIPASVEKLYTSATALLRYGADGALTTSVLGDDGLTADGVLEGDIYLHGGGDPSFGTSEAGALARALIDDVGLTEVDGDVVGDESAFDERRGPPSEGYRTTFEVGPLSALTFNHGYTGRRSPFFQVYPARFAARAFKKALRNRGVKVRGRAVEGRAPADGVQLGAWSSPTIAQLIRAMNLPSDNFFAETLIKALGMEFGTRGTTAAGAQVVRSTVAELGLRTVAVDGSGLSRSDRTSPRAVVALLQAMDESDVADAFEASLPVAGRTGTLSSRMRGTAARGRCHAKTGTLSNVSALAGYCHTRAGRRVAFAFLMNNVWPASARVLQDRMAAALARYSG